jgi:hypothetical protein
MFAVAVAHDGNHRRAGVERLDQAGHQVGRARAERGVHQADAAGDLGVGVGGEHAGALVVDQVVVQSQPPRGIVEGEQLEAAHSEHRPGAVREQHADQGFTAGDFHRAHIVFHLLSSMAGCINRMAASNSRCGVTRTWSSRLGA